MLKKLLLSSFITISALSVQAEEVTLKHNGLTLNANLKAIDDQPLSGRVALITHGTLAHNGMEIISTLQTLLADEDIPSLAINLNLGINNRHGMYDCNVPHNHKHTDAVTEISLWQNWLQQQGAREIILVGHSRGGNQTAWYADENPGSALAQVLVAPATWNHKYASNNYRKRYQTELKPILDRAKQADADSWLENTGFIYCADTSVTAASFVNYYEPDQRFDTPSLLQKTKLPSLVIIGSEDKTVSNLPQAMANVSNDKVKSLTIEGADHYFRDLYADEVVEGIIEFLDAL